MKLLLQSLLQQILKLSVTKAIFKKIVNIDDFTANFSGCINCNYVVRSAIAVGKAAIYKKDFFAVAMVVSMAVAVFTFCKDPEINL